MKDVIEMLLKKQSTLEADKEAEKALALERIDAEYAERSEKYVALLEMAGYVPPPVEEPVEVQDETDAETVESVEEAQPVYGAPTSIL